MRTTSRLRSIIRPFLLAGGLLLLLAPWAGAVSTPKLTNQITDQTGVLESGLSSVQTALDSLQNGQNVQLWLVFIPTTGSATAADFARQTFEANGLGGNDMILLVAVNDHRYGWWEMEDSGTGLPTSQIDSLLTSRLEPRLRAGDYAGGVVDFTNALANAVEAVRAPAKPTAYATAPNAGGSTSSSGSGDSGTSTVLWALIAVILIGGGLIFVYLWIISRRNAHLSIEERDKRTGNLARQANQMLLATDDALHEAGQDLGFAQAEFSDEDVAPYAKAIAVAQDELKKAFGIRQQLDDSIPEDQPTKERMYGEIIVHCTDAKTAVDTQAKRLAELRDLEKTAPQALAALPQAIEALQGREPAIRAAQQTLSGYAPSSWEAVKGNAEEADKRGHFAEQQIATGNAALAATPPNANAAAHAARAAQEAVAQANQLLDAVEQQAAALKKAGASLADEIAAVEAALAAANRTAQGAAGRAADAGDAGGAGATAGAADLAKAETLLSAAKNQAGATAPDTIAALKAVQSAHATADTALAGMRDAAAAAVRARTAFDSARAAADTSIRQTQGFIAPRRSGVRTEARTRLAEAMRHLGQADALAATDLAGATNEARTAESMADEAYSLASSDFSGFDQGGGGYSLTGGGGGGAGNSGSSSGDSILGGIIGALLSGGGGRKGGGFGGSSWGSGGGWTGGGSHGGGGFGGFGGGGGHGGGGSFGGGGGGGGHGGGGGW